MNRRDVICSATALAATAALPAGVLAQDEPAPGFGFEDVAARAQALAAAPFVAPDSTLLPPFADLNYDQYRAIRFRRHRDPWAGHGDFRLDLLPPGLFYNQPVEISLVQNGVELPQAFNASMFDFDPSQFPDGVTPGDSGKMGFSGFRIRTPLNRPDVMDEVIVFQGASYFRAVSRGTLYGISARGLALGTGQPGGEEFPIFRAFWIHTPAPRDRSVTVHALLDSKSVAGAYEFTISPGAETVVETRLALFPRVNLANVGIAPLTSMFWFGPGDRSGIDDYRNAVHDSDGLQMLTGSDRRLWRALNNPPGLQFSNFMDVNPRGFGLAQRERSFDHYNDMEARYELRPSAWIAPRGDWGKGAVTLIEIPVSNEFNDNIVSFWQPAEPLARGQRHDFAYDLSFAPQTPDSAPISRVLQTRAGASVNEPKARSYVIDFSSDVLDGTEPVAMIETSAGKITGTHLVRLPREDRVRLAFQFWPEGAKLAELSARLDGAEGPLSETWFGRWTEG
ncbi:MAG: glucan biosynthesis protein G [Paracoccus sp. (in: a-proteobacteria)]|nr:glucan biosynthesis protein G [Paracoccus sp. (in: a-proteobacteria)]